MNRQPTPATIAAAEEGVGDPRVAAAEDFVRAMTRARDFERAGDTSACEYPLADAEHAIEGPTCSNALIKCEFVMIAMFHSENQVGWSRNRARELAILAERSQRASRFPHLDPANVLVTAESGLWHSSLCVASHSPRERQAARFPDQLHFASDPDNIIWAMTEKFATAIYWIGRFTIIARPETKEPATSALCVYLLVCISRAVGR
jgi:hypothetical protein